MSYHLLVFEDEDKPAKRFSEEEFRLFVEENNKTGLYEICDSLAQWLSQGGGIKAFHLESETPFPQVEVDVVLGPMTVTYTYESGQPQNAFPEFPIQVLGD